MDVNQPKPETTLKQSRIRKELKERKNVTVNQIVEAIQPFKSYRKQKENDLDSTPIEPPLLKDYPQPFQLKRQYLSEPRTQKKAEASGKYKYEIDAAVDENQPPSLRKAESRFEGIEVQRSQLIRKNIKSLSGPFEGDVGRRKEVQSIIFDSKVTKLEILPEKSGSAYKKNTNSDKSISDFQLKVNKVNDQIEAGISHVQTLIAELKKKKVAQSQIQAQQAQNTKLQQLEREFAQRRALINSNQKQMPSSEPNFLKNKEKSQMENSHGPQKQLQVVFEPQSTKSVLEEVEDSQIQLQGDFKNKEKPFPPEYISFINRLSHQIEKDAIFTNKITELTKSNNIQAIRQLIFAQVSKHKHECSIDESFFQIEPSEIDPLGQGKPKWYKQFSEEELKSEALKIYKNYKDIQTHFSLKLLNNFSQGTVELLFEELSRFNFTKTSLSDSDSVTVGHLLSYLNMRTNKSFRNRSFVKMLKRLGLKSNGFLTMDAFGELVRR